MIPILWSLPSFSGPATPPLGMGSATATSAGAAPPSLFPLLVLPTRSRGGRGGDRGGGGRTLHLLASRGAPPLAAEAAPLAQPDVHVVPGVLADAVVAVLVECRAVVEAQQVHQDVQEEGDKHAAEEEQSRVPLGLRAGEPGVLEALDGLDGEYLHEGYVNHDARGEPEPEPEEPRVRLGAEERDHGPHDRRQARAHHQRERHPGRGPPR